MRICEQNPITQPADLGQFKDIVSQVRKLTGLLSRFGELDLAINADSRGKGISVKSFRVFIRSGMTRKESRPLFVALIDETTRQ